MIQLRLLGAAALAAAVVSIHSTATACGGCFHPKDDAPSIVTDHRMVLSVSKTQTVLWDQVRYQGNPTEFAWVLPVGPGARVELARAEWLSALDIPTAPAIAPPPYACPNGGVVNNGGGGGCGLSSATVGYAPSGYGDPTPTPGFQSTGDVTVVNQSVVGPYLAVIIRSDSGLAIAKWLTDNGFEIPLSIEPTLASYTKDQLDFLALRLRPDVGVQAMAPVRVITPGADPTLPLRMVAAGTGTNVGLLLYVVSEGRYEAANFANATIPLSRVTWNASQSRSNYAELFNQVTSGERPPWVTEYAGHDALATATSAYRAACLGRAPVQVAVPCGDAGTDVDGGNLDAGDVDGDVDASSVDGGDAGGPSTCYAVRPACDLFDDDKVATKGLNPSDVYVTRLRTTLPTNGLVDLRLAAAGPTTVSAKITATSFSVAPTCVDPPTYSGSGGGGGCACDATGSTRGALFPAALGLAALALMRRRRR